MACPNPPASLPPDFFANPKCPPVSAVTEATTAEIDLIEPTKDLEANASNGNQS